MISICESSSTVEEKMLEIHVSRFKGRLNDRKQTFRREKLYVDTERDMKIEKQEGKSSREENHRKIWGHNQSKVRTQKKEGEII